MVGGEGLIDKVFNFSPGVGVLEIARVEVPFGGRRGMAGVREGELYGPVVGDSRRGVGACNVYVVGGGVEVLKRVKGGGMGADKPCGDVSTIDSVFGTGMVDACELCFVRVEGAKSISDV